MSNAPATRQKITGEITLSTKLFLKLEGEVQNIEDIREKIASWQEQDMSSFSATLLGSASLLEVSDIHIEAIKQGARLRVRVDGILQDVALLSEHIYNALVSRIKLLSGLKLNVADRPQDGRFTLTPEGSPPIEVRVSSLPSEYGESLVLRLLNPKSLKTIQDLGLRKDLLSLFQKEIKKPNGMILVTGPTGSGKTTTLYAFLKDVQSPEIKVITIEDPIEYHLDGISQTQVNPKEDYTFASGLRAIVRQDPDAILVGEIRDPETAAIALQAALTGHLVFSTLHTNDAAGTIARLLSLKAAPANISAALNLIIAQRLVRVICKSCSQTRKANEKELKAIKEGLEGLPLALRPAIPSPLLLAEPKGCRECGNTGYKGRIGVFEAIATDDKLEEFAAKSPSVAQLKAYAVQQGMITMHQDGLFKVLEKTTTLQEVERAAAE